MHAVFFCLPTLIVRLLGGWLVLLLPQIYHSYTLELIMSYIFIIKMDMHIIKQLFVVSWSFLIHRV